MATVYGQYAAHGFSGNPGYDWRHDAACRNIPDEDKDMFFPVGESGISQVQADIAKRFCDTRCTVRDDCLKWALATREEHGVWGGKSAKQRTKILAGNAFEAEPEYRRTRQCRDCAGTFEQINASNVGPLVEVVPQPTAEAV